MQRCKGAAASQIEPLPRQLTGFIARFASAANLGPDTVDGARRRNADLTDKGGATIAVTLHAPKTMVGKHAGDAIEIALVLGREPGPVAGKRTARTAAPTERSCIRGCCRNPLRAFPQVRGPHFGDAIRRSAERSLRLSIQRRSALRR